MTTVLIVLVTSTSPDSTAVPSVSSSSPDHEITVIGESGIYTVKHAAGEVVHVGQDEDMAIDEAMRSPTPGRVVKEDVLLRGDFTIARAIEVSSYTILQLDGKVVMEVNIEGPHDLRL